MRPRLVIVDSVQTMLSERVPAVAGSITQVREVAAQLVEFAKRDGSAGGAGRPRHQGGAGGGTQVAGAHGRRAARLLRRQHPRPSHAAGAQEPLRASLELALFAMGDHGLTEVANPSAALLGRPRGTAPGSAVAVVLEGTTPLLVEVQALVSRSSLANPRRVAQGVDPGRMALLLAVLERVAGMRLADRDVFVNVVGGIAVDEPALDLAVAAAVLSSLAETGAAGRPGPVRRDRSAGRDPRVSRPEERLREAAALGFTRCAAPAGVEASRAAGCQVVTLESVADLARLLAKGE